MARAGHLHGLWLATLVACAAQPSETSTPTRDREPVAGDARDDDAAALEIVAQIDGALETWRDSCPRANAHGLCVALEPVASTPERCGAPELGAVVVHARDSQRAASAQRELAAAMQRAGCNYVSCGREGLDVQPEDAEVLRAYRHALASARIARADASLEEYLALALPRGLDFVVEEWKRESGQPEDAEQYEAQLARKEESEARMRAFLDAKQDMAEALRKELAMVKRYRDEEMLLRAALRSSWAALHLSDELSTAEIPASLRSDEMRDAYCKALAEQAARPRAHAVEAAFYCKMHAEQSGSDTVTARACRELLQQLGGRQAVGGP